MELKTLAGFFNKMAIANPSLKRLTDDHLDVYFEILSEVPEDVFRDVTKVFFKMKVYGWPGAGEIYELCMGQKAKQQTVVSDGERIWYKTLASVANIPIKLHDEWKIAQKAIDMTCGCIADIRTADEQKLGFMKREFIKLVDSGMIQRGEL